MPFRPHALGGAAFEEPLHSRASGDSLGNKKAGRNNKSKTDFYRESETN